MDVDAVASAIVFAEQQEIAPLFRTLRSDDVSEKSPGEIVTSADRACESVLTELLRDVRDVPVVGEEAAATDPDLIALIGNTAAVWVVDPLDGTSNFANGDTDYAVMVAFVERGEATASWMWHPHRQTMATAERGAGAFVNKVRCEAQATSFADRLFDGVVKERFLPAPVKLAVRANLGHFGQITDGRNCAGLDYPDLVAGTVDFLFYWRTLSWDHAPGVLFAEEAGCLALRPDGVAYRCDSTGDGLVVAHQDICDDVRRKLLSPAFGVTARS